MDSWFTVEQIDQDTFVISEYRHWEETHCYLLCGTKKAILIDTGLGVSNIREVIDGLTKLPVTVITEYLTRWGPGLLRLGAIMSFGGYCVSRPGLLRLGAVVG